MKSTEKKQPIDTIPKGVWESSCPADEGQGRTTLSNTTDLQGNGYPKDQKKTRDQS